MLVGAIAGPIGMLVGAGGGKLAGKGSDLRRAHELGKTVNALARSVPAGSTAVLAAVADPDPEPTDRELTTLGGRVGRFRAADVVSELELG